MRLPLIAAALAAPILISLSLAACSQEPEPIEPAPAPTPTPTVLGGVDLGQPIRALGTEPFWGVDVTASELVYTGVDRPERRGPHSGPVVQGTTATWDATTTEGPLKLTLMATECSDGMSDRTYPLTARLEVGTEVLNGCAASTAAIMSAGESGPVTPAPARLIPRLA